MKIEITNKNDPEASRILEYAITSDDMTVVIISIGHQNKIFTEWIVNKSFQGSIRIVSVSNIYSEIDRLYIKGTIDFDTFPALTTLYSDPYQTALSLNMAIQEYLKETMHEVIEWKEPIIGGFMFKNNCIDFSSIENLKEIGLKCGDYIVANDLISHVIGYSMFMDKLYVVSDDDGEYHEICNFMNRRNKTVFRAVKGISEAKPAKKICIKQEFQE